MRPLVKVIALFTLAFALPCLGLWFFLGGAGTGAAEISTELFPEALEIPAKIKSVSVQDSSDLEPLADQEFLLAFWVRLNRLPRDGERFLLIKKIDGGSASLPGYAVTLRRDGSTLVPGVYWRNASGQGAGYSFAGFEAVPNEWYFLALSSYKHYLGFHVGYYDQVGEPKLLLSGGADTGIAVIPHAKADLSFGALEDSTFRGAIGPLVLLRGNGISKELKSILREMLETPLNIEAPSGAKIIFSTIDGLSDLSEYKRTVLPSQKRRAR